MDYGRRFRIYRDKKKLTQKEAAELLGVTPYQLGNYETNRSEPNIATLKKMSQIYQVSLDRLLGNSVTAFFAPGPDDSPKIDLDEIKEQLEALAKKIEESR